MRTARFPFAVLVAALGLAGGACAGKEPTGPAIALSQEEVFGLAGELGYALNSPALAGLQPGPINITADCSIGGSYSVAGSSGGDTTVTADVTVTYYGCRTGSFTTSGAVWVTGTGTGTATAVTVRLAAVGNLSVSVTDGRSGTCPVDLTVSETATQSVAAVTTVTGTACGVNVGGTY